MEVTLSPTRCAICETESNATEIYRGNHDPASFSPATFSARRIPDRVHYRMVRCNSCGLVRSDPVADPALIAELYARSTFDYANEAKSIQRTYGRYLERLGRDVTDHSLLEIGCGNGFFLEEALRRGYADVWGVEPSRAAVEQASPEVRPRIINDMIRPGLFPEEHFDAIVMFQVLDHLSDPQSVLSLCRRLLKPGGAVLALNHNVEAWSARLLKDRSPIIDIEHTYLYGPETMRRLFDRCGFKTELVGTVFNSYSLSYVTQLAPIAQGVKLRLIRVLKGSAVGRISLRVPLGNLYSIGRKV
jgi:SAM-dependent methyltransferase